MWTSCRRFLSTKRTNLLYNFCQAKGSLRFLLNQMLSCLPLYALWSEHTRDLSSMALYPSFWRSFSVLLTLPTFHKGTRHPGDNVHIDGIVQLLFCIPSRPSCWDLDLYASTWTLPPPALWRGNLIDWGVCVCTRKDRQQSRACPCSGVHGFGD